MAITMPKIDITFEQRAVSLIGRSERGVAILIVRDDTNKTFTHKQYSDLSAAQADESLYTADNYAAICDMLGFAPYQAHVFRCDAAVWPRHYRGKQRHPQDCDQQGADLLRRFHPVRDPVPQAAA